VNDASVPHRHRATTDDVDVLVDLLAGAERAVALTGAGISTGSGLPDFRSSTGLWTRYDPRELTFQRHVASAEVRRAGWAMRREFLDADARANPAHHALADLQASGHLGAIVTQNIDGLHQSGGATDVIELHGTAHASTCIGTAPRDGVPAGCGWSGPTRDILARIDAGEDDPDCPDCGGLVKAATISFGQSMDPMTTEAAWAAADQADLVLAIGTSLQVVPAASIVPTAHERGIPVAICNAEPTPWDGIAEVVCRDRVEDLLPRVAAAVRG